MIEDTISKMFKQRVNEEVKNSSSINSNDA